MTLLHSTAGRRWLLALLCAAAGLAYGCWSSRPAADTDAHMIHSPAPEDAKFDAPLRRRLREAGQAPVRVLLQLEAPTETALARLEEAGLQVETTAGPVVLASGTPEAVRRAARHAFVRHVQLDQPQPPSSD